MSLMQRVANAGSLLESKVDLPLVFDVAMLRDDVYKYLSAQEIANLVSSDERRARSEISSACNKVFEEQEWQNCSSQEQQNLRDLLLDSIFGLGPLENMLEDQSISEIMVNGTRSIYFEKNGNLYKSEQRFTSEEQLRSLIDRIIGPLGRRCDEACPIVNGRLANGHRVHAIIPPLAIDGPILTIRKFTEELIKLEDMLKLNSIDSKLLQFLSWMIKSRKNIAVSGGTGTGKTTLLNALSCKIALNERIITIEDCAELRFFEHPHVLRLEARTKNAEGVGEVSIRDLVITALRMRPDRIVVGECRSEEALDMLQAMNTGHDGSLTTLHANNPKDAIVRLTSMVRFASDLPVEVIENNIASAIDLIIQLKRDVSGKRYVSELAVLKAIEGDANPINTIYVRKYVQDAGTWSDNISLLDEIIEKHIASAEEVSSWQAA